MVLTYTGRGIKKPLKYQNILIENKKTRTVQINIFVSLIMYDFFQKPQKHKPKFFFMVFCECPGTGFLCFLIIWFSSKIKLLNKFRVSVNYKGLLLLLLLFCLIGLSVILPDSRRIHEQTQNCHNIIYFQQKQKIFSFRWTRL